MKVFSTIFVVLILMFVAIFFISLVLKPKPLTIVCIGDSLTSCGGQDGKYTDWLATFLPKDTIINKGIGGNTLADGRSRFQKDVMALNPDIVVIALGANDFWKKERTIDQLRDDLEYMIKAARDLSMQVVIASCFGDRNFKAEKKVEFNPENFTWASQIALMEQMLAQKYACFYVPNMQIDIKPNGKLPYWQDKNHPNKLGNELVAKRILAAIQNAKKIR